MVELAAEPLRLDHQAVVRAEPALVVPVDQHRVVAAEQDLRPAVAVEVGQEHLGRGVGREPLRRRVETVLRAPVEVGVDPVLELVPVVGHHQVDVTVAVQVGRSHRPRADAGQPVLPTHVLEAPVRALQVDVQRQRAAGVVVVDPRGRKDQVQAPVAVHVDGGHVVRADRRQVGPLAGESAGSAPVDVAEQLARHAVGRVDDDQVLVAVAVEVDDATHVSAVRRQLAPLPVRTVAGAGLVDPRRAALVVALRVRQHDVHVAVVVDVGAVDGLDDPLRVDVQVAAAVLDAAGGERLEPPVHPGLFVHGSQFSLLGTLTYHRRTDERSRILVVDHQVLLDCLLKLLRAPVRAAPNLLHGELREPYPHSCAGSLPAATFASAPTRSHPARCSAARCWRGRRLALGLRMTGRR